MRNVICDLTVHGPQHCVMGHVIDASISCRSNLQYMTSTPQQPFRLKVSQVTFRHTPFSTFFRISIEILL